MSDMDRPVEKGIVVAIQTKETDEDLDRKSVV